ncbi:MAG: hypothetical protein HY275_03615 [Gemmatimonadetes bacterium]|nr:hypothetical protein [Gemmatimonadota bacterium]
MTLHRVNAAPVRVPRRPALRAATLVLAAAMGACGGDKGTAPNVTPGSIAASSAITSAGRAGLFPADTPVVIVKGPNGAPIAGVPVTFTVSTGGGSIALSGAQAPSTTVTTNGAGLAGVKWRLGGALGTQTLTAKVDTFPGVVFSATVTPGYTAQLLVVAGNNQTVPPSTLVPVPPQVQAKDVFGNPVPGDTIDFSNGAGGNTLTGTRQVADANGLVTLPSWTVGNCPGAATVNATSRSIGNPSVAINATVTGTGNYCIELVYTTTPDASLKATVENAAARWSRVITQSPSTEIVSQPNFTCAGITGLTLSNRTIKSLLIYVQLAPIASSTPGLVTLGSAGPCFLRNQSGLTVVGAMRLNSDYLLNNVAPLVREDVVLHEMGHVLGFGTLWTGVPGVPALPILLPNPATTNGAGNPGFVGSSARNEYIALGAPAGVASVPVENCGGAGTINGHWKEGVLGGGIGSGFGTELMTGYASAPAGQRNPFSRMSIAAMEDLGYTVDMSQADSYTINSQACPVSLLALPPGTMMIGNSLVEETLQEPTHIVRNGRARPIIWR